MSTQNNCTVTLHCPLPTDSAQRAFYHVLAKAGFSCDWDGDTVSSDVFKTATGVTTLYGRNVDLCEQDVILKLAQHHKLSVIVHAEWWGDYESDTTGSIMAYDKTDGRVVDCWATNNSAQPLVSLQEAISSSHELLQRKYGLPADLS
jgi:hypothetical protein